MARPSAQLSSLSQGPGCPRNPVGVSKFSDTSECDSGPRRPEFVLSSQAVCLPVSGFTSLRVCLFTYRNGWAI